MRSSRLSSIKIYVYPLSGKIAILPFLCGVFGFSLGCPDFPADLLLGVDQGDLRYDGQRDAAYENDILISSDRGLDAAVDSVPACPSVCTGGCLEEVCRINCSSDNACMDTVSCPPNMQCEVLCTGKSACQSNVNCAAATDCIVYCTGSDSCQGPIVGGTGACNIQCTGARSCAKDVDCSLAKDVNIACGSAGNTHACRGDIVRCGSGFCAVTCQGLQSCKKGVACQNACGCEVQCTDNDVCQSSLVLCPGKCQGACGPTDNCKCQ